VGVCGSRCCFVTMIVAAHDKDRWLMMDLTARRNDWGPALDACERAWQQVVHNHVPSLLVEAVLAC
jgi:hypothetical protein